MYIPIITVAEFYLICLSVFLQPVAEIKPTYNVPGWEVKLCLNHGTFLTTLLCGKDNSIGNCNVHWVIPSTWEV